MKEVKRATTRMSNWKAARPNHVQGFWFKKATSLHPKLKKHLQECVNAGAVPTWMTEGLTVLTSKGTVLGNYRPIACLPLMWKLLTSKFSEAMYGHLSCQELLPNEQKGCRKNSIDIIDIKPGGTWDSGHQKRNLSRGLIITITVCDHQDTTVTDSKGHNSWLPIQERKSPASY